MTSTAETAQRILIIDDSEDDRSMFERLLRQDPNITQIDTAESGSEGLALFETAWPDCILLDFNLPGHDGLDVLGQLKEIDRYASVVMLTGQGSEDVAVAAMKAGASDYVIKDTISAVGLRRAVNNAIDKTRLQRRLDTQQNEQELFLRTLLHDVRAPLRHISTFSECLESDVKEGDFSNVLEYCGDLGVAAKRIEDLIDTLAAYAFTETDIVFKPICMTNIVRSVISNLSHRISERNAVIRHEPLPSVNGHAPQLMQLMQNLIGNGIKYCDADRPVIEITVSAADDDRQHLFTVQDNGIGIPTDRLTYVFQPFHRLWSQDDYEGTGLGLAICQKIVKRHGGRIWCDSETGRGSSFFFTLEDADSREEAEIAEVSARLAS